MLPGNFSLSQTGHCRVYRLHQMILSEPGQLSMSVLQESSRTMKAQASHRLPPLAVATWSVIFVCVCRGVLYSTPYCKEPKAALEKR